MSRIKGLIGTIILTAAVLCLGGCSFGGTTSYTYANGDKYTAGDREITDRIEKIDINYMSGEVKLVGGASDTVTIKETAEKQLDEKRMVHTWVDGTTLYVRYCASAKHLDLNNLRKHLEITIPASVKLSDLKTDVSSADLNFSGFETGNTNISASSGDIQADITSDKTAISASSGSVDLTLEKDCAEINLSTSSGKVQADLKRADKVDITTSSGSISVNAEFVRDFNTSSSSGTQEHHFKEAPEKASIEASSGDVSCYLPEDADIAATLETSSGEITYELPFSKSGDDIYVCGLGLNRLEIETSSGDVSLKKN